MTTAAPVATGKSWLLEPGTLVDHFSVLRPLGSGGMAEVYLARDQKLGRKVALKLLRPGVLDDAAKERFLFEAKATARFSHPHIVTIHFVGEHKGAPYLALEYVEGQTLRERMAREALTTPEVTRLALAVAQALAEAHANQIQHRDLKPENIILASDGRPRVLDFGLAQVFDPKIAAAAEDDAKKASDDAKKASDDAKKVGDDLLRSRVVDPFESMASGVRGSPAYMAPERWRLEASTGAADVWSLGVILFELLGGKRPFESPSLATLVAETCSDAPAPALEPREPVPPELGDVVAQCLDKDPEGRPSALELVQTLEKLQHGARAIATDEESPFRGLLPFGEQHADLFFGRDVEIASFVERLRSLPVMPVLGPSGAGKSSFVQAGVIPRLRERGPLVVIQMRPGRSPFVTLAARIVAARRQATGGATSTPFGAPIDHGESDSGDKGDEAERLATQLKASPHLLNVVLNRLAEKRKSNVLLFVDQLEELATLVPDEEERLAFMQAICAAADDPQLPVRVVMTLREEFISRLARGRGVREAMGQFTVLQSPGEKSLHEIVQRPVEARGYSFDDPTLVEEIVAEVKHEVACLPLLQFAGQKIWESRDKTKRLLTREAYRAAGGVTGALARHADAIVAGMTAAEANLARSMLLRMVTPEGTRRVLTRQRLIEGLDPAAGEVLQRLVDGRLVTVRQAEKETEAEHELAHESLVVTWERFARWIDESREELVFLDEVGRAAELWEKRGQRHEELWQADALRDAQRALEHCTSEIPSQVMRFIEAAQHRQKRSVRRRRIVVTAVIVLLAALAGFFALKEQQTRLAERDARAQKVRAVVGEAEALLESASVALKNDDPMQARSRLRSSLEGADSTAGRMLWQRLRRHALVIKYPLTDQPMDFAFDSAGSSFVVVDYLGAGYRVGLETAAVEQFPGAEPRVPEALSLDARWLAFGRSNGEVVVRNLQNQTLRVLGTHDQRVVALLFTEDGRLLASAGDDAAIRLWDVESGKLLHVLKGHNLRAWPISFGKNGTKLVTAGRDRAVRVWDVASGRLSFQVDDEYAWTSEATSRLVTWTPSKTSPVTAFHLYDIGSQQLITEWTAPAVGTRELAISRDGSAVVLATSEGRLAIVDAINGARRATIAVGKAISKIAFNHTGDLLFSADVAGDIRCWRFPSLEPGGLIGRCTSSLCGIAPGLDNRYLLTWAFGEKSLFVFDLNAPRASTTGHRHASKVIGVAVSPDGTRIVTGGIDGTARVWDTATAQTVSVFNHNASIVFGVAFSPDSKLIATAGADNIVHLWDAITGQIKQTLRGHVSMVWFVAFGPDGRLLASVAEGQENPLIIWDLATGLPKYTMARHASLDSFSASFSPDGRTLVVGAVGPRPVLLNVATGREIAFAPDRDFFGRAGVAFGCDGRTLITGGETGEIEIWELDKGKARTVIKQAMGINFVAISPDGKSVGSTSADGTVHVWDIATGESLLVGQHHGFETNAIRFTPDGKQVVTTGDDNTVRLWDLQTKQPVWRVRAVIPRLNAPPEMFTHRGWETLTDPLTKTSPAPSSWRSAAEKAKSASSATSEGFICMQLEDNSLAMLDQRTDRVVTKEPVAGVNKFIALPNGCASIGEKGAGLVDSGGSVTSLCPQASALGRQGSTLLVACGDQLRWFDSNGNEMAGKARPIASDVTALAADDQWLLVGHKTGAIETIPLVPGLSAASHSLDQTRPSEVTKLIVGPMNTLIAGQLDGNVSIWDLQSGGLLERVALHGAVEHMLLDDKKLYAVSELGDPEVWDLSVLYLSKCELLQQVWNKVPSVWEGGRSVVRKPAAIGDCTPAIAAASSQPAR